MTITDETIFENVSKTIKECLNNDDINITRSSTLAEDLDLDSSDAICLIMDLEEMYNISIEDEVLETFSTVECVVNHIQEKMS